MTAKEKISVIKRAKSILHTYSEPNLIIANDHSTTKDGGWWYLDREHKIVYLYAKSIANGLEYEKWREKRFIVPSENLKP